MMLTQILHQNRMMEKMSGKRRTRSCVCGNNGQKVCTFVGDSSSDMAEAVSRWCTYAKWDISKCSSMEKFKESDKKLPGMLILESEKYALDDNLKKIEELEQKGVFHCLRMSGRSEEY